MITKENFLCPRSRYYGHFTPENLLFNDNLQEFAIRVSYIANLETGGKISPEDSYEQLKTLWTKFESVIQQLHIAEKAS